MKARRLYSAPVLNLRCDHVRDRRNVHAIASWPRIPRPPPPWRGPSTQHRSVVRGTGNSAAKLNETNVWRLYQALDLGSDDQIAYHDDGVGTSGVSPLRFSGARSAGACRATFGSLRVPVPALPCGRPHLIFGFSRGTFTARTLAGLIRKCGILDSSQEGAAPSAGYDEIG